MYNLGEQFKINKEKALANEKNIKKGEKFRFTVLSERLIRLEYNLNGTFLDNPTQFALYRNADPVDFECRDTSSMIEISTKYFKLTYMKNKSFEGNKVNAGGNLKVELLGTDRAWYYGHPEVRNFKVPSGSLEGENLAGNGLYSAEGMASFNDSRTPVFNEDGTVSQRTDGSIDIYLFMYNNQKEHTKNKNNQYVNQI